MTSNDSGTKVSHLGPFLEHKMWDTENLVRRMLQDQNITRTEYMTLYSLIYFFCTRRDLPVENGLSMRGRRAHPLKTKFKPSGNKARLLVLELYNRIKSILNAHLEQLLKETYDQVHEAIPKFYKNQWEKYQISSRVLNDACGYLNKKLMKPQNPADKVDVVPVYTVAMLLWKEIIFEPMHSNLTNHVIDLIDKERSGILIDSSFVSFVVNSYLELDGRMYQSHFEKPLLHSTEVYYNNIGSFDSVPAYLKRAEEYLLQEEKRAERYFPLSLGRLLNVCQKVLIQKHLTIFPSEFQKLLKLHNYEDIQRMFSLLVGLNGAKGEGVDELPQILYDHIMREVLPAKPASNGLVNIIYEIHTKYYRLISVTLQKDNRFYEALRQACEAIIKSIRESSIVSSCPLATHCDSLLKKSARNLSYNEWDVELEKVIIFFDHMTDKDIFLKYHRDMLAMRLVHDLSVSDDVEREILVSKLNVGNNEYTEDMKCMFEDMVVAKDMNIHFQSYFRETNASIDMAIRVLKFRTWHKSLKMIQIEMPLALQDYVKCATDYFSTIDGKPRQLHWMYHLDHCELVTNCFKSKYILLRANIITMAVLLQFNERTSYTVEDLVRKTGQKECYVMETVEHLIREKLLLCGDDDCMLTSVVDLNYNFFSKKKRIDINLVIREDTMKQQQEDINEINAARNALIDAAIVRIMKMRRELSHEDLLIELGAQVTLRFKPKSSLIKERIEKLIDVYIGRKEGHIDQYFYIVD